MSSKNLSESRFCNGVEMSDEIPLSRLSFRRLNSEAETRPAVFFLNSSSKFSFLALAYLSFIEWPNFLDSFWYVSRTNPGFLWSTLKIGGSCLPELSLFILLQNF